MSSSEPDAGIPLPTDLDPLLPPPEVLRRHGARVLDPLAALLFAGQPIRPTAYVSDQLLTPVRRGTLELPGALVEAADKLELDVKFGAREALLPSRTGSRLATLEPRDRLAAKPDAWTVLQKARSIDSLSVSGIGLNHLMVVTPGGVIGQHEPNGGVTVNSLYEGSPTSEYGLPGRGGRAPLAYVGQPPHRRKQLGCRRPVVAVLDMGCGVHPWLPLEGGIVERTPALDGANIGLPGPGLEVPFTGGRLDGMLHWAFGHGTFNCGLIRQICPDADLLSVQAVPADGVVDEWTLVRALDGVYELARRHNSGERGGHPVDVVSLSLGYYHEQLIDAIVGSAIQAAIERLGQVGVAVVASAGNDATVRELLPAAWSLHTSAADAVPLVSVGALNPDGTVALFSNGGPWVRHWETGVAVISTMPRYDGGATPSAEAADPSGQRRRSFDPDSYRGFASWSGTSFAAPVLAGRVAQRLIEESESCGTSLDDLGEATAVKRTRAAIRHCVPHLEY